MKDAIDLHKGMTILVVLGLMAAYDNFTLGPWTYLALHGSYSLMWVAKSRLLFPDEVWEAPIPVWKGVGVFGALLGYWVAPFLLVRGRAVPPSPLVCAAVVSTLLGTFLHYGADAQKYYVLQVRRGLITNGFFARTRNPNYLGEMFIYAGFAMMSMHWLPFLILGAFVTGVFVPNMLRKDRSLSRYPDFAAYRARSGLLLPRLRPPRGSRC